MDVEKITKEKINFAYEKQYIWDVLNEYIYLKTEMDGQAPEFVENWKNEFFDCETVDELRHFSKFFIEEMRKLNSQL